MSATSRIVRAISFGVLPRLAPSTMAIMRSRNAFAGVGCNTHDDPVGQHACAAGDRTEVSAGFADHRRGFASDRGFVDGCCSLDHFAIGGNDFAGFDQNVGANGEFIAWRRPGSAAAARSLKNSGNHPLAGRAKAHQLAPCRGLQPEPPQRWRREQ